MESEKIKSEHKNTEWIYYPFIVLSKTYIKFFRAKKDFWIIFPSAILSLIINLNIYVLTSLKYNINIYWIAGLYFLLYFVLFFVFNRKFPNYKLVREIKLNRTEIGITISIILLALINSVVILNFLRNSNI